MRKIICATFALIMVISCIFVLVSCNKPSETTSNSTVENTTQELTEATTTPVVEEKDDVTIRVGSLKGPTSIGLVNLMNLAKDDGTEQKYSFVMEAQGATLSAMMIQGTLDIALIPANLASNLYNKTGGQIVVLDINTLGVLYCVTGDENIKSMSDLSGKTIVTTGQGSTPEFAIKYLLSELGISDYTLEFKSEATEVASVLKQDPSTIAVLPQPFVTVATSQNTDVKVAFSLNDEWTKITENTTKSKLVTGVTVVRKEFYNAHKSAVKAFLSDHEESVKAANENLDLIAKLMVEYGIIANEGVAKKAIPYCNVVCIKGEEMKSQLSGYLNTLFVLAPNSIGGSMPEDDFYLILK